MATRLKTIKYAFPTTTSIITDATVTNLTQITVYIPESSPTFVSVTADVAFQDIVTATGGTITEHRCGLQVGAAGYTTVTETDDIANSAENLGGVLGPFDFTSHFTTNWTGTSMTCDVQVYFDQSTGTTLGMRNVNAELTITYSYDDDPGTNATQIKTARIPLESLVGTLSTTANSNIGTSQIPQLTGGGILPEASVAIRDYYFLIEGNVANNNTTTDFTVTCNIDSGASAAFGVTEAGLGSDYYTRLIYKPSVPTTTTTHNFQMWSSVTNKMNHVCVTLVVTYEFDPASSTTILNSLLIPVEIASPLGVTTSAEASRFTRELFVQEPATITFQQSAFRINFNTTAAVSGLNFRAGGQAFRAYTNIGNVVCGMFSLQQRIDSGGAQGAGMTLARGSNTITIDGYATDTTDQVTNISGYIIVNYHSGKATSGLVGQHSHTTEFLLSQWNALLADRTRVNNYAIAIPESNYWLVSVGFMLDIWQSTASNAITLDVEVLSGESKGAGYLDIYADAVQTDAERGCSLVYMRGRDVFKRYPADPDPDRLDVETARDYRLYFAATAGSGLMSVVTYHSFTYSVSGTVTGYAGSGIGLTVNIYRSDTKTLVGSVATTSGGAYTFTWYDNTIDLYAECIEDATHVGRSDDGTAA
ncbi:MAG: hypothetical protein KBD27_01855 [Candidatus Moranbacteria bacterium]|nr:hypothetical protein [Candidatus Moranbacteria bacterium]